MQKKAAAKQGRAQAGKAGGGRYPLTIHCVPVDQKWLGENGKALCGAEVPAYHDKKKDHLSDGRTNSPDSVTCAKCRRLFDVRDRLCKGCGAMITDATREIHSGHCPNCRGALIDLDKDNKFVGATYIKTGLPVVGEGIERVQEEALRFKEDADARRREVDARHAEQASKVSNSSATGEEYASGVVAVNPAAKAATPRGNAMAKDAKKGNPEALKKAQEAMEGKRAIERTKKIKVLKKEMPHREGSKAETSFKALLKAKTVGDYQEAGGDPGYLRWYVEHDIASVG